MSCVLNDLVDLSEEIREIGRQLLQKRDKLTLQILGNGIDKLVGIFGKIGQNEGEKEFL